MDKVSFILTTYNSKDNMKRTITSILSQDYPEMEIVIKDGASTDGTVELIQEYQEKYGDMIKTVSQKDTGIYDAMNQGYALSTGDIIIFFNDVFSCDDAVSKFVAAMEDNQFIGVHSDLLYVRGEEVVRKWHMGNGTIKQGWMPGHPTLFLRREVYEKYGLYNSSYKISADYEIMVRILKDESNKLAYIPENLVLMEYGGTSSGGLKNYMVSMLESEKALRSNHVKWGWIVIFKRILRFVIQFK